MAPRTVTRRTQGDDTSLADLELLKWLTEGLDSLGSTLEGLGLPPGLVERVMKEVDVLKGIFETRPARFVVVGRRGAGKSTFINAIFGEPVAEIGHVSVGTTFAKWYPYRSARGEIEILDTRGLGEGQGSGEGDAQVALDAVEGEVRKTAPDVVLFLCKAKEVAARIDEDIEDVRTILRLVRKHHAYEPPLIGVLTQVDELDPPHIAEPPFPDDTKQANIQAAKALLGDKLAAATGSTTDVFPVCAYVAFDGQGAISYDRRWSMDKLVEHLVEKVPQSAQLSLARIAHIKRVQKRIARSIVASAVAGAAAVAMEPIPVADMPIITGVQVAMVTGIAYVSGRRLDRKAAAEFIGALGANVGLGLAFKELFRALSKLWVGPGNLISGGIAAGATVGIGQAAIAYFIEGASKERARQVFDQKRKPRKTRHTKTSEAAKKGGQGRKPRRPKGGPAQKGRAPKP
jgi:uncharacterized protein (DUF697 family)/GTP-binding protein EngB required for normal cell division